MTFTFTDEMIRAALIAHGWFPGWNQMNWVPPGANADYCDYTTEQAFRSLLDERNLVDKSTIVPNVSAT